jgi:hypothetical protein
MKLTVKERDILCCGKVGDEDGTTPAHALKDAFDVLHLYCE